MTSLAWDNLPTVNGHNPCEPDNFDMTNPHFLWVQKLNAIRRTYPALQNCETVFERWRQTKNGNGIFAFIRGCGGQDDWVLVIWNTWRDRLLAGGSMGNFFTGWNEGDAVVNVSNPQERYVLTSQGKFGDMWLNGYETMVFVRERRLMPLEPVVVAVNSAHDQVANKGTDGEISISLQFSEDMNADSARNAIEFDNKPVPASSVTYNPSSRTLSFSAACSDGIRFVRVRSTAARDNGIRMHSDFVSRFRVGSQNNVTINKHIGSDPQLVKRVAPGSKNAILQHKAASAEKLRVRNDDGPWSAWQDYASTTK